MKQWIAAAALAALAACASSTETAPTESAAPAPVAEPTPVAATTPSAAPAWSYSFDAGPGIALARLTQDGGTLAEISCKAPKGPVVFRDYRLGSSPAPSAQLTVGSVSATAPASVVEGGKALQISIDPRDAVFKALAPNVPVSFKAAGDALPWDINTASRLNDVINACVAKGS